jgi:hypothetical protein
MQAWLYTNGTQHAGGGGGPTDGSVTFDNSTGAPVWPLPEGPYDAYFICCDGWTELAGPASFTVSTGGPCTPTDIHIAAVACGGVNCGAGKKNGKATVTIEDDCGNAVENALVDGTFTGYFNESFNDVPTDATGKAEFITAGCIKGASFTFTVDDVTGGSLPYDPGDDVETGCIK